MTIPLIGLGHGLTLEQLSPFVVEPQISEGVHHAQRDVASDHTIHQQGVFCVLLWPVIDGVDDLDALLTQMGLEGDSDLRAAVTAYLPTTRSKWHLYQGYANMPQSLTYAFWPSGLRIMLNQLSRLD